VRNVVPNGYLTIRRTSYTGGWFHYAKLYTALAGSIGFMLIKYEIGIGKQHWFRCFPFVIVTINILIAVCSTVLRLVQASMLTRSDCQCHRFGVYHLPG